MPHIRRRPARFQFALTLVALLSAALLGGVQEASCAMHGLGAAVRTEIAAPAGMSHADHASGMSHESGRHSSGTDHSGCDCTCIGSCTTVAPLFTSPAAVTLRVALIEPEPRRPLDIEPAHAPPVEPDRLLPFGNGPPASERV